MALQCLRGAKIKKNNINRKGTKPQSDDTKLFVFLMFFCGSAS